MSTAPGQAPLTDAEWARDVQRRLDAGDAPSTARVGQWVLSVGEDGELRASRSDGVEAVIADAPAVEVATSIAPVLFEHQTQRREDVTLGQWDGDDKITLPSMTASSGRVYFSAFPTLDRAGQAQTLRFMYSGNAASSTYRAALYVYDEALTTATRVWSSDELRDIASVTTGVWLEGEIPVDITAPLTAGVRLVYAHAQGYGGEQRYPGCAACSIARPASVPILDRFPAFYTNAYPGPFPDTVNFSTDVTGIGHRRLWASLTMTT